jgi:hypothetical protein
MVDAGRQRGTVGRPRKRPRPSTALTADMGAVDLPVDPRLAAVCALVHMNPVDQRILAVLGTATGTGERTVEPGRVEVQDIGRIERKSTSGEGGAGERSQGA